MVKGVRDRSREILRNELADAAASFCVEHGFDDVTAAEIAQGIGISRATFFRYFTSKEDAVVSAARVAAQSARSLAGSLASELERTTGPTRTREVLLAAMEPMIATAKARKDPLRARLRMITEVPALSMHVAAQRDDDRAAVAEVLRDHVGGERTALVLADAVVSAVDLAWQEWARTPDSDLGSLMQAYFGEFEALASVELA
jgi:AcrR family transcriptional regulator